MSIYAPLVDGPAIPTLDQLSRGEHTVDVESREQAKIKAFEQRPTIVESVAVVQTTTTTATEAPVIAPEPCCCGLPEVSGCCCGCSLSTGVYLIALFESMGWSMGILSGIFAIVLETQKGAIDNAIRKEDADEAASGDADSADSSDMSTSDKVHMTNQAINAFAIISPFLIIMALIGLFYCFKGFKAARGDTEAARAYFLWRRVMVVYAFVNLLMGANGGFLGGLVGVALAVYYALVCRSHYRALQAAPEAVGVETTTTVVAMAGEV
jgi:hypothetical protein